jgi:hypothetical protein
MLEGKRMSKTTHGCEPMQNGSSIGAGGGGPAAKTPSAVQSITGSKSGFVVVEELLCKPDCLSVGRKVMQRWREDATVIGVVKIREDWIVKSAKVMWTVEGVAKVLDFGGLKIPRKKEVGPGERCLEDVLMMAIDQMAEFKKDDGTRLLQVTHLGMVPRFVTGRLIGDGRTVRVHCGVKKPEILSQIVVRPNTLTADTDLFIFP